jgi:putative peptidoglycan lipid II flippase
VSAHALLRSTALVAALTVLAKASGLFRDVFVAAHFGTSAAMDAYVVAATIVSVLLAWLRAPIQVVLVPIFSRDLAARGEGHAWEAASTLLNSAIALFVLVAAAGSLLAPALVGLVAPGLDADAAGLAARLTRIMMAMVVLLGVAQFLSALLFAYQKFGRPGLTGTVDNVVIVGAFLALAPTLGIYGLALAGVLGAVAQVLIQAPLLWKHRAHYRRRVDFRDPALRRMAWLGLPMIIGTGGAGLGKISDRIFASLLSGGRISALAYAHQLTYATFQLFAASLTTVLFPFLSKKAGLADYETLTKKLARALTLLFAVVLPVSAGLVVLHEPLVRVVFHRGAFTQESVRLTGQAVLFYAVGLAAYTVSHVLSYAFYSVQNTRTPVVSGLVRLGVKIVLSFALIGPLSHGGLALAESLSFVVKAALLFLFLPSELRCADYGTVFRSFGVTAAISGVMALVVLAVLPLLDSVVEIGASFVGALAGLVVPAAVGAAAYVLLALLVQPLQVREAFQAVRAGLGGRR